MEDGEDIINSSADEALSESNDTIESIEEESVVEALEDEIVPVCTADGFTIDSSGIITAYTGSDTNIVIPAEVRGLNSNVFQGNTNIYSVDFSSNTKIKRLPNSAFSGCTSLTNVKFSEYIDSIGNYCFSGCSSLNNVMLPTGLISRYMASGK